MNTEPPYWSLVDIANQDASRLIKNFFADPPPQYGELVRNGISKGSCDLKNADSEAKS